MFYTMNVERIKGLLLITIGIMTATMAYYVWSFNKEKKPPQPIITTLETKADVVVSDVELRETSGDRTLWMLRAKVAEVYNSSKEIRLEDIEIDFFDEKGKSMHLTSDRGIKDDKTGNIIASGDVRATSYHEGIILKTSELVYDANTNKITSDKHIIIERGNMVTSGEGLESDLSLSEPRILRNVTTSLVTE
jgi:LPS export ABC transporter protein LptC